MARLVARIGQINGHDNLNPYAEGVPVLSWTILFLLVAIVAGILGFYGVAGAAAVVAKVIFVLFVLMLLFSAAAHSFRNRPPV